jgi:hypothetical protein
MHVHTRAHTHTHISGHGWLATSGLCLGKPQRALGEHGARLQNVAARARRYQTSLCTSIVIGAYIRVYKYICLYHAASAGVSTAV